MPPYTSCYSFFLPLSVHDSKRVGLHAVGQLTLSHTASTSYPGGCAWGLILMMND